MNEQKSNKGGEVRLKIVEGFFYDDWKVGFDAGYNVVIIPHEWPDEEWFHLHCLDEEVAQRVLALAPGARLVNPRIVYVEEIPKVLRPEANLEASLGYFLGDFEEDLEEDWDDDDYELEAQCPECGEVVGWWDETCANCGAQLLPLPSGGFNSNGRPNWGPRQVRTPRGIKPGNVLTMAMGRYQERCTIVVLTKPYPDKNDPSWWRFDYLVPRCPISPAMRRSATLGDFGVIGHAEHWNRTNYLERTGRKRVNLKTE